MDGDWGYPVKTQETKKTSTYFVNISSVGMIFQTQDIPGISENRWNPKHQQLSFGSDHQCQGRHYHLISHDPPVLAPASPKRAPIHPQIWRCPKLGLPPIFIHVWMASSMMNHFGVPLFVGPWKILEKMMDSGDVRSKLPWSHRRAWDFELASPAAGPWVKRYELIRMRPWR